MTKIEGRKRITGKDGGKGMIRREGEKDKLRRGGVGVKEIVDGNKKEVEIMDEREKWEVKIRGMKRKGD